MTQLMQYHPAWAELERDLDALFGEVFGPEGARRWSRAVPAGSSRWAPACDVFTRDGDLVVELDLPGIDPGKDVQVTVQDGMLCISGERHTRDPGNVGYYRREWRYGAFERGFTLPERVTGEGVTASYHNGAAGRTRRAGRSRVDPARRRCRVHGGRGYGARRALGHDRWHHHGHPRPGAGPARHRDSPGGPRRGGRGRHRHPQHP